MTDFIVLIGNPINPQQVAQRLQDRPGLEDRIPLIYSFEWGTLVIQTPPGNGYEPFEKNGKLYACVGRPRIVGCAHEARGPSGFCHVLSQRWNSGTETNLFESLTGTHALLHCSSDTVSILTDRMGAFPIYGAEKLHGRLLALGTSVDILSMTTGCEQDWDLVSLAELLVFNNITYPFSSRVGIKELPPASITNIAMKGTTPAYKNRVLWEPAEPSSWLPDIEMIARTEKALQSAALEATRGARSAAVTLSGGLDSRAVLAALPKSLAASAITYVTHENNETRVAQKVAQTAGAKHLFAPRDEDYFANVLLDRGIRLLGSERRAAAHGFCVNDNMLQRHFDVILGGQLSDTFLKNHYMPFHQREKLRPKGIRERLRILAGLSRPKVGPKVVSTIGRHLALVHLKKKFQEAVVARREARQKEVQAIRPVTGEEWSRFWPTSRQDDLAHVLGNVRLFPFDTLFMQKAVIEVAVDLAPHQRYAGRIANQAFARIYGLLGDIENANTGTAASAGEFISKRRMKIHAARIAADIKGAAPWNNVQTSWADNLTLQRSHPKWVKARAELKGSPAIDLLDQLTEQSAGSLISEYTDSVPPTFNQMLIQIGIAVDFSSSYAK